MSVLRSITVEPVLFAYMLGLFLKFPVSQQLYFKKTCSRAYNSTFCQNIFSNNSCGHGSKEYDNAEGLTSQWLLYDSLANGIPSVAFCLIFGSLSDHFGRKSIMVLPLIGNFIESLCAIVNVYYIDTSPAYMLIGSAISGCFGGFSTILMVVFSYISDISNEFNRTMRVGILESMTFFGGMVGDLIGGILIDHLGFMAPYIVVAICSILAIFYVRIRIQESYFPEHQVTINSLFTLGNYKGCFEVLTKTRPNKVYLLLLIFIGFVVPVIVFSGTVAVVVLFVLNHPFCFSSTMIGYFLATNFAVSIIGVVIGLPFMNRVLKLSDTTIVIAGIISTAATKVFLAFAKTAWQVFLVLAVGIFSGLIIPVVRAMCSKLVEVHEHGSLFAVLASLETISTMIASIIFQSIYRTTVSTLPGLSFLIMAGLLLLPLCLMILSYRRHPSTVVVSVQDTVTLVDSEESST